MEKDNHQKQMSSDTSDTSDTDPDDALQDSNSNDQRQLEQSYRQFILFLRKMTNNQHILHHNSFNNEHFLDLEQQKKGSLIICIYLQYLFLFLQIKRKKRQTNPRAARITIIKATRIIISTATLK